MLNFNNLYFFKIAYSNIRLKYLRKWNIKLIMLGQTKSRNASLRKRPNSSIKVNN